MSRAFDMEPPSSAPLSRSDLRAELADRDLPRHLALFYESKDAQLDAVTAFLERGLSTNRKCLYLYDVNSPRQIRNALRTTAVDVEQRMDAGDLAFRDATEVYLDAGFDPARMIRTLEDAADDSLAAGYDGLYVAGENSWCFHTDRPFDHVIDFEADFDARCPDLPVVALCQYDLTRFGEESVAKALRTHENVVYRNLICENPFYVPPGEFREAADVLHNVRFMLEQAYSLTRSRRQVGRHEQRLEVVNRVLRHNIRNDLNVVAGTLEMLQESGETSPDVERRLDVALQYVTQVFEMAERARYVQGTVTSSSVEPVRLGSVIDTAVEAVTATYPEADVDVTCPRAVRVLADEDLDLAILEVLENGIVHQERDPPTVSVTVSTGRMDAVRIDVWNPGTIPEVERQAVREGSETQLNHVSGLGLWLIQWVVENSHGSLTFPATDDGGVTLRIELTPAPPR